MSFGGGFGGGFGSGQYGSASGRTSNANAQLKREDFSNVIAFEKNFYVEHPAVTARYWPWIFANELCIISTPYC